MTKQTKQNDERFKIECSVKFDMQDVYGLVTTGVESGPYGSFHVEGDWRAAWEAADRGEPQPFAWLTWFDHLAEEPESVRVDHSISGQPKRMTDSRIEQGLQLMAEKAPHLFAEFLQNQHLDAVGSDDFLQLCLLGKIVYG